jgi:hypothetical protein
VTSPINGELYLRLAGERMVLDPPNPRAGVDAEVPLPELASALVAAGALATDQAQRVVDDYGLAIALRNQSGPRGIRGPTHVPSSRAVALSVPRVVTTNGIVDSPWGRLSVQFVSLSERSTSIAVKVIEYDAGRLRRGQPNPPVPFPVRVTDDQGRSETANFSPGFGPTGGGSGALRYLTTSQPLSRSTAWIELDNDRIELTEEVAPPSVIVERFEDPDPVAHYLWTRVANSRPGQLGHPVPGPRRPLPVHVEPLIHAMIEIGALSSSDPLLSDLRAVARAFIGEAVQDHVPEPFRSMVARGRTATGPTGAVALGVITPPVEGTVIALESLVSSVESFTVRLSTSPDLFGSHAHWGFAVNGSPFAWWAKDDLGHHYLAALDRWGSDGSTGEGGFTFWPALDAASSELVVMPTGAHERAVVTVSLPDWNAT